MGRVATGLHAAVSGEKAVTAASDLSCEIAFS